MTPHPVQLQLTPDRHLLIAWSDGQQRRYSLKELQDNCPCATCREKRREPAPAPAPALGLQLAVLKPEEAQPLQLKQMTPVGNYAYALKFNYGCDHGIYRFELLRELGEDVT